ncbi:MAG: hypothetical protein IJA17_02080 [Oscillospiraceae bacterium]|nr:hypothetical protein [Oscillospiraceae bacterium]
MKNELFQEYYSEYLKVKRIVREGAKPGKARKEAFENIYALYFDAQKEKLPLSEIHEGTAEEFAAEILKSLPRRGIVKRWQAAFLAVFAVLAFEALLYFTSDFYFEKEMGLAHALNNPDRYNFIGYETVAIKQKEGRGKEYYLSFNGEEYEIIEGEDIFDDKEFEKFVFSEDGERISAEVKIPFVSRISVLKSVDLPVNLWSYGHIDDVNRVKVSHGHITLEAGESFYNGYFDYFRTEKNGDIYLGFVFIKQKGPSAEEHILSGETFTVDFGRIYRMYWSRRMQDFSTSDWRTKISIIAEHIHLQPFFRFAKAQTVDFPEATRSQIEVEKTSESGRFTVTAHLNVDFETKKIWDISFVDENNFEDTAEYYVDGNDFGVIEGRKKAFVEVTYRIEGSEEWLTERIEYTFEDFV